MTKKYTVLILAILLFGVAGVSAQSNDDCLACHNDRDMTMDKGRKTISVFVDPNVFSHSVHGTHKCISCHVGFNPDDIPHKAKIEPVNCKSCHVDIEKKHTFHPWMINAPLAENCKQCHGTHNIAKPRSSSSQVAGLSVVEKCGACHTEQKEAFMKSEHYAVLQMHADTNAPDCSYCHSFPITKGWDANYDNRKIAQMKVCAGCHSANTSNTSVLKRIDTVNSRHLKLRSEGFNHAAVCTDCHGFHDIKKNQDQEIRIHMKNSFSVCGKCHVHIAQEYQNSIHGMAQMMGNLNAASCVNCHDEHQPGKQPVIAAAVFKENLLDENFARKKNTLNCISCHTNDSMITKNSLKGLLESHKWLPSLQKHFATVSCYECHASYVKPNLSHNILAKEKSIRDCEPCHNETLALKSVLYQYRTSSGNTEGGKYEGKMAGLSKNVILDYLSVIILIFVVLGLAIHGFIRWYFNKRKEV